MGKKRKKKKVLLSGSDPFYLSKKLRRRRYGEVSAQTSQKSQNRALVKKKVAYRAPAAQACTPPTWTINRIFSKSEILAESLLWNKKKKKKKNLQLCKLVHVGLVFFQKWCHHVPQGARSVKISTFPGRSPRGEKYFFSLKNFFPEKMTFCFAPGLRPTGAKPCINK